MCAYRRAELPPILPSTATARPALHPRSETSASTPIQPGPDAASPPGMEWTMSRLLVGAPGHDQQSHVACGLRNCHAIHPPFSFISHSLNCRFQALSALCNISTRNFTSSSFRGSLRPSSLLPSSTSQSTLAFFCRGRPSCPTFGPGCQRGCERRASRIRCPLVVANLGFC